MNRISDLHTIVKLSNICNQHGLIKEADQLLNVFTKLAQEDAGTPVDKKAPSDIKLPAVNKAPETTAVPTQEQPTTVDKELEALIKDLNQYTTLSLNVFNSLSTISNIDDVKNLLPDVNELVKLSQSILSNPKIDEENKNNISENLEGILDLQQSLNL